MQTRFLELPREWEPGDPTPEQIADGCQRIRSKWSPAEARRRSAWAYTPRVQLVNVDDSEVEG
jgi:hypothetical protein